MSRNCTWDAVDKKLVRLLGRGASYKEMVVTVNLSVAGIRYRLSRFCRLLGLSESECNLNHSKLVASAARGELRRKLIGSAGRTLPTSSYNNRRTMAIAFALLLLVQAVSAYAAPELALLQVTQHSATLSWTASTSTVAGYNVYRRTANTALAKIGSTSSAVRTFQDASVLAGTTYFYAVTSFDASAVESIFTNEITAAIPANPPGPVAITTSQLPNGTAGVVYLATLTATDGVPPYVWSATGLPSGLVVFGQTIAGTPLATGAFSVDLLVTGGTTAMKTLPLQVAAPPPLAITTTSLPSGTVGQLYAPIQIVASGGVAPYQFVGNGLPPGLAISAGGSISGTPTAAGSYSSTITVTDSMNATVQRGYSQDILPVPVQTFLRECSASVANATFVSCTLPAPSAAGNAYGVIGAWNGATITATVTDSSNDVVSPLSVPLTSGTFRAQAWLVKAVGATSPATVRLNLSAASDFPWLKVVEYSVMDQDGAAVSATGTGTTMSTANVSAGASGVVLAMAAQLDFAVTATAGAGFTMRGAVSSTNVFVEDRSIVQAGSFPVSMTRASTRPWIMFAVALKPGGPPPPPPVSITIAPTAWTMQTSTVKQFVATVSNSTNTGVDFSASCGAITIGGIYTAPSAAGLCSVTATSQADAAKSAVASVTVTAPPPPVSISVAPTTVTLTTGQTQQFTATVQNSSNTAVSWSADCGTVNTTGLYTAPSAAGSCVVTTTSQADATKSALAMVTVILPQAPPPTVTMTCGTSSAYITCTADPRNAVALKLIYNGRTTDWSGFAPPLLDRFTFRFLRSQLPKGTNTFIVEAQNSAGQTATVTVSRTN